LHFYVSTERERVTRVKFFIEMDIFSPAVICSLLLKNYRMNNVNYIMVNILVRGMRSNGIKGASLQKITIHADGETLNITRNEQLVVSC